MRMTRIVEIFNASRSRLVLDRVRWCESLMCRSVGRMFRGSLGDREGLLLVQRASDAVSAGIHMMFVFSPLGVLWLEQDGKVVDSVLAKPWRVYVPKERAYYILEGPPRILDDVSVGEVLEIRTPP
jgi:uncharacterized membrane protein (UPF0127 family)